MPPGRRRARSAPPPKARCATRWKRRWTGSTAAGCASPRSSTDAGCPSMAQEGGAALLPAQRHGGDRRRRTRGGAAPGGTRCRRNSPAGTAPRFREAGFRAVPGSVVRRSAYIAPGVVLMPSFVNVGACVDSGTMVDTWATVGSCAQIGKNCHLSGGVGIGGVLEPVQAEPVIIEDDCFIGARSEVVEGVIVERRRRCSPWASIIGATTKIIDRATGEVYQGRVPRLFRRRAGEPARQALRRRLAGAAPLLRRHHQAGRRADPRQDLDQRAAARLMPRRADQPLDPVELAAALIRRPSVTPGRAGAMAFLAGALEPLGFACHRLRNSASPAPSAGATTSMPASARAGAISASPAIPTWCRRAMSPPGAATVRRPDRATARCTAAAPPT